MDSQIGVDVARAGALPWDADEFSLDRPLQQSDGAEKVVFVTMSGMEAAESFVAEYTRSGARVAVLDVQAWSLYFILPEDTAIGRDWSEVPLQCASWVSAVEEVIDRFGPIQLWIDTREMSWPAVSRSGMRR